MGCCRSTRHEPHGISNKIQSLQKNCVVLSGAVAACRNPLRSSLRHDLYSTGTRMDFMTVTRYAIVAFAALIFSMTAVAGGFNANLPAISYVSFESPNLLPPGEPLTISGELRIPTENSQEHGVDSIHSGFPAIVLLHGSAGVDSRGSFYIDALNKAGIATLEIDMWSARGMSSRPNALPDVTVPDAFSALRFLAKNPSIDPDRIGVLGFSWGGVIALLSATKHYNDLYGKDSDGEDLTFAAHVAHYPVCWVYNANLPGLFFDDLTGNFVLIQIGDRDDYDDGSKVCESLAAPFANVSVNVYKDAYHAWDRLQAAMTVNDPFSHQGAGGEVEIVPSPWRAFQSRYEVVRFFKAKLGM